MNEQQAVNLISEVCAKSNGDLNYHQLVQQALKIVMDKAFPVPVPVDKEPGTIKPDFNGNKKKKSETVAE